MRNHLLSAALVISFISTAGAQDFEEAVVDVGNIGLTITNSGFFGKNSVRNNPSGPPSMEYPLDSGVEHLFEAGIWIGAVRSDGVITVRTGAVTASTGYAPGALGFELAQSSQFFEASSLIESDVFTRQAISHQDFLTSFSDTSDFVPGTQIPTPDRQGRLGLSGIQRTYAWNFPFTEAFVILDFDIVNTTTASWDSVYVSIWHDSVVRNVNTTTEVGGNFFNKGGFGTIDSLNAIYAFNAGGDEESLNTYSSILFLGAEWRDPQTGLYRFWHPDVADEYVADGLAAPQYTPRWWTFGGNPITELARPSNDQERYRRMGTPYPNPAAYPTEEAYLEARDAWYKRLQTDGQLAQGNWIGLTSVGPFRVVEARDTLHLTFAAVTALKPDEFQSIDHRATDDDFTREKLLDNIVWARRTFRGEDINGNGRLDPGEDSNGNGVLDRYIIPEPPGSPFTRVELEEGKATIYWNWAPEFDRDPVTGLLDFEGYRIYASNPGDDLGGDIFGSAGLVAQYDKKDTDVGFNNGFDEVRLPEPVSFPGDTLQYQYAMTIEGILSGWQYAFIVTAFDTGDESVGLPSFESSRRANAVRVFPGTPAAASGDTERRVGVYPNPYRVNAAWDGTTSKTRKLNFYNLPASSEVRIYSLAGEVIARFDHDALTYAGDIRWYDDFSGENRLLPGGEHSWDVLSENGLSLSSGLYIYSVKDLANGDIQTGKFAVIR